MVRAALITDYDGTIAHDGVVDEAALAALERLRAAGWCLVLVTGRELGDVQRLMPRLDVFDRVVAENGAVLHTPATGATRLLASPPGPGLAAALAAAGVQPVQCGQVTVATWASHEAQVLSVLATLDLPWRVVHNKGGLMALPPGVDKRSGTLAALLELGVPSARCVGLGDAENDLDLLAACGLPVAVANALPVVKQAAALVLRAERSAGIAELVEHLLQEGPNPPVPVG